MHDDTRSYRSYRSVSGICLALFAVSCGAATVSEQSPAPAASSGDEPPPSAAVVTPAPEAPAKAQRGRLVIEAEVHGKRVAARAKLLDADDSRSTDFQAGEEISSPAGTQRVEVALLDDTALVDKPTQTLEVFIEPNKRTEVKAAFPWAKVQLDLLVNGRSQAATRVKLVRAGNVVAEVKTGAPMFEVSPGTYEADVSLRGKVVRVKGLVFFEGSAQVIPVRAQQ